MQLPTHEAPGAPLPAPSRREEEEGWFACKFGLRQGRLETLAAGTTIPPLLPPWQSRLSAITAHNMTPFIDGTMS